MNKIILLVLLVTTFLIGAGDAGASANGYIAGDVYWGPGYTTPTSAHVWLARASDGGRVCDTTSNASDGYYQCLNVLSGRTYTLTAEKYANCFRYVGQYSFYVPDYQASWFGIKSINIAQADRWC